MAQLLRFQRVWDEPSHEQHYQPGISRSVHSLLPAGMDQVGARAGVDHRMDGDRVVYVHELLGATTAPEPLDCRVDVLFGVPRGVDWTGGISAYSAAGDGLARMHR